MSKLPARISPSARIPRRSYEQQPPENSIDWFLDLITSDLNPNQIYAVRQWAEDVILWGISGPEESAAHSVLLLELNKGNFSLAQAEFGKWCLYNDRIDARARKKRLVEAALFANPRF